MEWKYNDNSKEWGLFSGGEEIVKIKIVNSPKNKVYKFKTKTFLSSYVVSKYLLKKYKNKNIMWIKKNIRQFKQEFELERYIS
ncbi:hypothetical protein KA977_07725, partial [Candidatus Dependentiae bacterium]|nr:hypothetical protein [Candidatus Dependentiae bacterium]